MTGLNNSLNTPLHMAAMIEILLLIDADAGTSLDNQI